MTSSQSFIEQTAEESFKGLNAFGPKEYIHQINIFYKAGFVSGVAWHAEQVKELVEALEWALDDKCKHTGETREGINREWCLDCSSWVYQSDRDMQIKADKVLSAFKETPSRVGKE